MKKMVIVFLVLICLPALVFGEDIYSGGIFAGWNLVQWNNTTPSAESNIAGKKTLMTISTTKFGKLYIQVPTGFKLGSSKERQTLLMSIMSPIKVIKNNFFISLHDPEGKAIHNVSAGDYIKSEELVEGTWYNLAIPVADLKATDQVISAVSVEIEEPGIFFADSISFSKAVGSYLVPSTVKAVNVSCQNTPLSALKCKATVEGTGNVNQAVTWGSSIGMIDATGQYIPPIGVRVQVRATITATSIQDPKVSGSALLNIVPSYFTPAEIKK